jgi:endonuclease/exonuclease/phosphatase family metal-dependent hydrolase
MVQPDIVALQETTVKEVDGEGRLAADRSALGFLMGGDYSAVRAEGEERLVALVREDARTGDVRGGTLDPLAPEVGGVMTRVELEWRGRPFALYVVHFRSYGRSGGPLPAQAREVRADLAARTREARLFRQLLEAETLPFVVAGDFNATPDQWTYAHVAAGLHDALTDEAGWAPTFPDERPVVQIDAVLASPEWEVVRAEVLPEGLSDHRGVLVDLRWAQTDDGRG